MGKAETSPATEMSQHFFFSGTDVSLNYESAERANTSLQNFSVSARQWYIDAVVTCQTCDERFLFSGTEQRQWYEEFRFHVDSFPNRCSTCRCSGREVTRLRQTYDASISAALSEPDVALKGRMISTIDLLVATGIEVPEVILERRESLVGQLRKLANQTDDETS